MPTPPQRLKRRAEFLRVASKGRKAPMPGVVLQALKRNDDAPARIGLVLVQLVRPRLRRDRLHAEERAVADRQHQAGLGPEGLVDRLHGHPCCTGDLGHRGGGVTVGHEHLPGSLDDLLGTLEQLLDTVLARVLDHLDIPHTLLARWGEPEEAAATNPFSPMTKER